MSNEKMSCTTEYVSVGHPEDVVTLDEIFRRYVQINGTVDGFEEYVNSGFRNGNEIEYEESIKEYIVDVRFSYDACIKIKANNKEEAKRISDYAAPEEFWEVEGSFNREITDVR